VRGFRLSEVSSALEQIGWYNPAQQKNKNKLLKGVSIGVSTDWSGTTKRFVTGERTSFDG
jgi:ribosomal protein S16